MRQWHSSSQACLIATGRRICVAGGDEARPDPGRLDRAEPLANRPAHEGGIHMRTLRLSLVGTVSLALVCGLGGAVVAQDESASRHAGVYFELVEETEVARPGHRDGDPRFASGRGRSTVIYGETPVTPVRQASTLWATARPRRSVGAVTTAGTTRARGRAGTAASRAIERAPVDQQSWPRRGRVRRAESSWPVDVPALAGRGDEHLLGIIYEGDVPPLGAARRVTPSRRLGCLRRSLQARWTPGERIVRSGRRRRTAHTMAAWTAPSSPMSTPGHAAWARITRCRAPWRAGS